MTGWKSKVVNEVQALFRKPISHDILRVFSAEFAEILCLNDSTLAAAAFDFRRLKPTASYPAFHCVWSDMESHSQCVFREAVFTHLCVGTEPVEHVPDRAFRPTHLFCDLIYRIAVNQFQQPLLLWCRPGAVGASRLHSHAPGKPSAGPSGITRFFFELCQQSAQFITGSVDIRPHEVASRFRPAKFAAGHSVIYITRGPRQSRIVNR